jgi:hypothetical protein
VSQTIQPDVALVDSLLWFKVSIYSHFYAFTAELSSDEQATRSR